MPIYEYQCHDCGQTTELLQKFSDAPLQICPACGGRVSKLMSANSFQLKGSGWYVTDYKGKHDCCSKPASKTEAAKSVVSGDVPACPAASSGGCSGCPATEKSVG